MRKLKMLKYLVIIN